MHDLSKRFKEYAFLKENEGMGDQIWQIKRSEHKLLKFQYSVPV